MFDIRKYIPTKSKITPNGWISFNAPCCVYNNESRDTRQRGGIKIDGDNFSYHCFNCNYSARFQMGYVVTKKTRNILKWLGVSDEDINKLSLESIRNKSLLDSRRDAKNQSNFEIVKSLNFKSIKLPSNARKVTIHDKKFYNYILSRGLTLDDYDFYITPNLLKDEVRRNKNRILIPYFYHNRIVGYTSRFLDDRKPKYLNEHQQVGYIFGIDFQNEAWQYAIVSEGILDAISIKGLAVMHNEFTKEQLALLKTMGKEIIVVPDQDKAGLTLIDQAMKAGFSISVPDWKLNTDGEYITDINEAVQKYGKAAVLYKILQEKVHGKIRIKMAVDKMKRRLKI